MKFRYWTLLKSDTHGLGVFAANRIRKYSFIDIAVREDKSVTALAMLLNHSYRPSAKIMYNFTTKTYNIYSIKTIDKGKEITINYYATPYFIRKCILLDED